MTRKQTIENKFLRGGFAVGVGGGMEGVTEVAQEVTEVGFKKQFMGFVEVEHSPSWNCFEFPERFDFTFLKRKVFVKFTNFIAHFGYFFLSIPEY